MYDLKARWPRSAASEWRIFARVLFVASVTAVSQAAHLQAQTLPAQVARGVPRQPAPKLSVDPGARERQPVTRVVAAIEPTRGNAARGTVTFRANPSGNGVEVSVDVERLPPGRHGFHVHLYGDCSGDDAKNAGTHFNFFGSSLHPASDSKRILGNLGELVADEHGNAHATLRIENATIQGAYSLIGRSVVIDAKPNDPSAPPIGAAGAPIACGVIGITGNEGAEEHAAR